jgi:hypothetical protein
VQHFRNLNRVFGEAENWPGCYFEAYASFWAHMGGREEVAAILSQLFDQYRQCYGTAPIPNRSYAEFIKQFSSSFPYQHDDRSIGHLEYAKFPIELLYDKEGDCECLSFLLLALLAQAGFQVALLGGYTKPRHQGAHAAVGLAIPSESGDDLLTSGGTVWVYCESVTTDTIGKCGFDFSIFQRDADVWPIAMQYRWDGQPPGWACPKGCCVVEPWVEQCPHCGGESIFSDVQADCAQASDWDRILKGFLDYMDWVEHATLIELELELRKMSRSAIWGSIPRGNQAYFRKTLDTLETGGEQTAESYLSGARRQLLSAWPHIVAAVFCQAPRKAKDEIEVHGPMSWLGMGVYEMNNPTLARFARKVLSDTTCKRIKGFSSGSRLAIGRILSCYEKQGDPYMDEKRGGIENILVKVVIPQVFALLARERRKET